MKEPILVVMAAGMGSRYGGLKQMDPVGMAGEVILDYSIFDAVQAGFKRVVFLIKHEIEEDFKYIVGEHLEKHVEVRYAYQETDMIPAPFTVPAERRKPWGTGHAVLCCRDVIDAPFAVINADDYYGPSAFKTAYEALKNLQDDADKAHYFMIGYQIENTLTEHGHVARGVCSVDGDGYLTGVVERTHIISTSDGALFTEDGETYRRIPDGTLVSMNLWGFTESFMDALEAHFPAFLERTLAQNPTSGEFYLPTVVNLMLSSNAADVKVLSSGDKWYGVTYQADKPVVQSALRGLVAEGKYGNPLWKD